MTNQQAVPETPRSTASDGKTELFSFPGHPLMVRAVDFNDLYAEKERLAALVAAQHAASRLEIEMNNQKVYGPWIKWHGGSGYGAQVIEENGRFALTFWPYCTNCQSPFQFDAEEPFAYCSCGTTEWGDPRPASWVCPPRQPAAQHADDVAVDALRLAAKSAAPYSTAMIGASHLNEAADTIDTLRAQLGEAQRDALDAARYRWLAAHCRSTAEHWGGRWSIVVEGPAPKSHDSEDDFDAAIDAAIEAARAAKAGGEA